MNQNMCVLHIRDTGNHSYQIQVKGEMDIRKDICLGRMYTHLYVTYKKGTLVEDIHIKSNME